MLLTTNTEVSIAPKLHKPPVEKPTTSATTSKQDPSTTAVFRVLPASFYPEIEFPDAQDSDILAYISFDSFQNDVLSTEDRKSKFIAMQLKSLTPPVDPLASSSKQAEPEVQPRSISLAGGKPNGNEGSDPEPSSGVYFAHNSDLPVNHIIFSVLPETVEDWDLVRYAPCFYSHSFYAHFRIKG